MMNGYDRDEAIAFIVGRVNKKEHPLFADRLDVLIQQFIDADMDFMHQTGVLDERGNSGGEYYEDDDAFEFIVEAMVSNNDLTPDEAVKLASLIDDLMDHQQEYMEYKGLVAWDD